MALAARSSLRTSAPRAARNGPAFTNRPVIARRSVVVKAEAVQGEGGGSVSPLHMGTP
jgi:hypothetical protein